MISRIERSRLVPMQRFSRSDPVIRDVFSENQPKSATATPDTTYLTTALNAWTNAAPPATPLSLIPLFIQGIVVPSGLAPITPPNSTAVGAWGVQWPHATTLTNPILVLVGS